MHKLGLSLTERAQKIDLLYEFIASGTFQQLSTEAFRLTNEMMKTDEEEIKQHKKIWSKRGTLTRSLQKLLTEINDQVEEVVEDIKVKEKHSTKVAGNVAYMHDLKTSKGN
jgi:hypothetical protein